MILLLLIIASLTVYMCNHHGIAKMDRSELDSFNFSWAMSHNYFVGKVVYPPNRDSISAKKIQSQIIKTIYLMSDTLVIIADNSLFISQEFPLDSLALIKKYRSKYNVLFDNEPPYYAYARNERDTLEFCKNGHLFYPQMGNINSFGLSIGRWYNSQDVRDFFFFFCFILPNGLKFSFIALVSCDIIDDIWYKNYSDNNHNGCSDADLWYTVMLFRVIDQKIHSIKFGINGTETII